MRARVLVLASPLALVLACIGTNPYAPGASIGTFAVTGTLESSSCGTGAPDPWQFSVQLSTEPGVLYWDQGSVPVSGSLSSSNAVSMTSMTTQAVYGDDAGDACILQRNDALTATLTPDESRTGQYTGFRGALTYTFSQASGSTDCSMALTANGGGYATLPCSVRYSLAATRTALPASGGQ